MTKLDYKAKKNHVKEKIRPNKYICLILYLFSEIWKNSSLECQNKVVLHTGSWGHGIPSPEKESPIMSKLWRQTYFKNMAMLLNTLMDVYKGDKRMFLIDMVTLVLYLLKASFILFILVLFCVHF